MIYRINAASFRRFSVLSSLASIAFLAFSCSSKTGESNVGPGPSGAAASPSGGGASAVVSNPGIGSTLSLGGELNAGSPPGPCMGLA